MRAPLSIWVFVTALGAGCASSPTDPVEPGSAPGLDADGGLGHRELVDASPLDEAVEGDDETPTPDAGEGGDSPAEALATADEEPVDEDGEDGEESDYDDGAEEPIDWEHQSWQKLPPHPLEGLSTKELLTRLRTDMASLGPISLGRIHGGALLNGVQLHDGEGWTVRQPNAAWGTQETIDALTGCITKVRQRHPNTKTLTIGHLSRKRGGRFPPHVSHQNGRDVDIAYYYLGNEPWYTRANEKNLDRARTWELVRCFITDTDVELILIDRRLQKLLRAHAESIGEDPHWLDQIFGGRTATLRPLIRHASGHATHIHVRFFSPIARETGRRLYEHLIRIKAIPAPTEFVYHRAKKGHTLAYMSRRYRVPVREIRRANGMRRRATMIRVGKVYRIPRSSGVRPGALREPIKIPPRRLPPGSREVVKSAPIAGENPGRAAPE